MSKRASKEASKVEKVDKMITKDTPEFKAFINFLKYNTNKGQKLLLAVEHWALLTKEQSEKVQNTKLKLVKSKYFADEKAFLELAKDNKKYSDVGGVRHYHRFIDFWQTDAAKKAKVSYNFLNFRSKTKLTTWLSI